MYLSGQADFKDARRQLDQKHPLENPPHAEAERNTAMGYGERPGATGSITRQQQQQQRDR